jgi:hypothetical protein
VPCVQERERERGVDGKGNRSTRVVSADRAHEICRFVQVIVVFFFYVQRRTRMLSYLKDNSNKF